jgi:hypothetical protein
LILTTAGSTALTASVIELMRLAADALLGLEEYSVYELSIATDLSIYLLIKAIVIKAFSNRIRITVKRLMRFKVFSFYMNFFMAKSITE